MTGFDYSIADFCRLVGGTVLQKNHNAPLRHLGIDSRKFDYTDASVFFAIPGNRRNGHHFVDALYKRGVRTFVVSEAVDLTRLPEATVIRVDNTIRALQNLAAHHRARSNARVVGITGSNGKTVVKEWLYQLLYMQFHILRSPKSYNSQVGVPLSLLLLDQTHEMALIEAGISEPGEMEVLQKMIQPEIGIFTNVGEAHQYHFESLEAKVKEKLRLFTDAKTLIYCRDHELIHRAVANDQDGKPRRLLTWSLSQEADLRILSHSCSGNHTNLEGSYGGKTITIEIPFLSAAAIENCCHLWLLLLFMEIPDAEIKRRFASLTPVAMRLEQVAGINGSVLINDAYNSDINALSIALDYLVFQVKNKKYTAILSDILQSGEARAKLYKRVADLLKTHRIDRFVGIGPDLIQNRACFDGMNAEFYESTDEFLAKTRRKDFKKENILVKGARDFAFERIIEFLQEKSHETVLEIDLSKLVHNLNYVRSKLKPDTKVMAMVKAFSYGSGSYDIARTLEYNRVDYLAVAYADEGIALRNDGIRIPIMVLNPEVSAYDAMIQYRLEPQLFSFHTLNRFSQALENAGEVAGFPVHIKLNTGMNRLGFNPDEIPQLADAIKESGRFEIKSVFSHLAGSDDPGFDVFTQEQISEFTAAADELSNLLGVKMMRHILNSNGILRYPDAQFDMVRLGLGLYGLTTFGPEQGALKPVSSLKTTISQIREIEPGEGVGYNPSHRVKQKTKIAVLSIGYADGLPRLLGNGVGKVRIAGEVVPFIGNICMDMSMVDISGVDCAEGDTVEVFGTHLDIYEMAGHLHTIPYEVITNISRRVKRVFVQD